MGDDGFVIYDYDKYDDYYFYYEDKYADMSIASKMKKYTELIKAAA